MERRTSTKLKTLQMVYVALMIAATCAATMSIRIPTLTGGYIHPGDSMVFLAAIILGKKSGVVAAAFGMALADVFSGYMIWAPFTLIIKGIMAYIIASIAYRHNYEGNNIKNNIFAFLIAGTWMVVAYYLTSVIITRFIYVQTATINESLFIALKGVPGNIAQFIVGIVIALPLIKGIKTYTMNNL
ncbi:hypothetical protein K144313037_18010 [Clostridium tetani]|uniref:ECF transporter S component n=1 Tax=Clostridium tetani TaxID=1513 RepID=A0ABC8EEN4_CLOTA|nr:ECF transporter S component [Clostridium tetani]BDR67758.1 hypothetical protein K144312032_19860 [Clostridium tetani]BDR70389.1 hypothetical protein K144313037_18010 [Clostridium tetani]BDR73182.1 hypothetical protein K144316041_18900 [Clostridium tetani]BDR81693.1 hypothetical protein K234311028_19390 [Clostridium tetani]BDR90075.1 hypothetical protein N072000002_18760 [Clostridium tetani]